MSRNRYLLDFAIYISIQIIAPDIIRQNVAEEFSNSIKNWVILCQKNSAGNIEIVIQLIKWMEENKMEQYLVDSGINEVLKFVVAQLCLSKPVRPIEFIIQLLQDNYVHKEEQVIDPLFLARKRRHGVFSEPLKDVLESTIIDPTPKGDETKERLDKALKANIICSHLDENERKEVFNAMSEQVFEENHVIIRQGDEEGDQFYVLDEGECDIYVEKEGVKEKVQHVKPGGSFGELALIYNTPRAATVVATTSVRLWSINRVTYRKVLMNSTTRKRTLYEEFLDKVPILKSLHKYERLTVADALEAAHYDENELIVRQGEKGDVFYIIVEGEAKVFQKDSEGVDKEVGKLVTSDYFGEIALLTDKPRAATVVATTPLKCVKMDRDRFNRVLGPCEDILRRNMAEYNQYFPQKN